MKTVAPLALLALSACYVPDGGDLFRPGREYACAHSLTPWPNAEHPVAVRVGLAVPGSSSLTRMSVTVRAKAGHATLPATMPAFAVGAEYPDGSIEVIGMARDASETVEAYETEHAIELDLTGVEVPPVPLVALSYSERGAGAVSGGRLLGWRCVTE